MAVFCCSFRAFLPALVCAGAFAANPPVIRQLGAIEYGGDSYAMASSADGSTVVGFASFEGGRRAFVWTHDEGMRNLGAFVGGNDSYCRAVSADGSFVVGSSNSAAGYRSFRWTPSGGMEDFDSSDLNVYAFVADTSADGSVVVGKSERQNVRAFRWDAPQNGGSGFEMLDAIPGTSRAIANAISADGTTIVGSSLLGDYDHAVYWTSGVIPQELAVPLPFNSSEATAVNADGSVVVGYAAINESWRAARWVRQPGGTWVFQALPLLTGSYEAVAQVVSDDGLLVAGIGFAYPSMPSFVWTPGGGTVGTEAYFAARGFDAAAAGWTAMTLSAILENGRVFVGQGTFHGHTRAFVLDLDPSDVACAADFGTAGGVAGHDGVLDNNDFIVFINHFFAWNSAADVGSAGGLRGGDGELDNNDFIAFIDLFFAGC